METICTVPNCTSKFMLLNIKPGICFGHAVEVGLFRRVLPIMALAGNGDLHTLVFTTNS